jgi:hypothetical protein
MTGMNDSTAKKPFNTPSTKKPPTHCPASDALTYQPCMLLIIKLLNKSSAINVCNPPPIQGLNEMK